MSCEKEAVFLDENNLLTENNLKPIRGEEDYTILPRAKEYFAKGKMNKTIKKQNPDGSNIFDLELDWNSTSWLVLSKSDSVLLVPYWLKKDIIPSSLEDMYIAFYDDGYDRIRSNIIGFEKDSISSGESISTLDGFMYVSNHEFILTHIARVESGVITTIVYDTNGEISEKLNTIKDEYSEKSCENRVSWINPIDWIINIFRGERVSCPSASGSGRSRRSNLLRGLFNSIGSFFSNSWTPGSSFQQGTYINANTFYTLFGQVNSGGGVTIPSFPQGGGQVGSGSNDGSNTDPGSLEGGRLNLIDFEEVVNSNTIVTDLTNLLTSNMTNDSEISQIEDFIRNSFLESLDFFNQINDPSLFSHQYIATTLGVIDMLEGVGTYPDSITHILKSRLVQVLGNGTVHQFNWLANDEDLTASLFNFLETNDFDFPSIYLLNEFVLLNRMSVNYDDFQDSERTNLIIANRNLYESACRNDIREHGEFENTAVITNPILLAWFAGRFSEEYAAISFLEPDLSEIDKYLIASYRTLKGEVHGILDVLGLFPGLGETADGINAIVYYIEGDYVNASLSIASMVPIVGWFTTGGKAMKIAWKNPATGRFKKLTNTAFSNGTSIEIIFTPPANASKSWRKYWNFPTGKIGHHMIPKQFSSHPLIQKAARSGNENIFHPHNISNGFPLDPSRHIGSHAQYSSKILSKLDTWMFNNPNKTAEEAADAVKEWQDELKRLLENSTGDINLLTIPDIL